MFMFIPGFIHSPSLFFHSKQSPIELLDLHDYSCDKFWLLFAQS